MKRTARFLVVVAVIAGSVAGVAAAASSPTVATGGATKITNTTATLNATVNPNGNQTGYSFQYGVTSAYGQATSGHNAGGGTKPVAVKVTVSGLTPGTTYHYHIAALNQAGSASGRDRTFTTTGPPPATVITGPPVNVTKSSATVTGSVNPQGASTTVVVQYGLSTSYGVETFSQTLAKGAAAVPVTATLVGLAPATLFHYRWVAIHNGNVVSTGADATFFTEPNRRPKPRLTTTTTPARVRHSPYAYTTNGQLKGAGFIPAGLRCTGSMKLSYFLGTRRIGVVVAPVGPDCKFTAQNSFRKVKASTPATITVKVHFNGNGYLAPANHTNLVTAG